MTNKVQLIGTRHTFHMIGDKSNFSFGIFYCSLFTRYIAFKDDYHNKRIDMLANTPVEFNFLKTLAKTSIIPARQNQFIQESSFNNATVRLNAIAMNKNSEVIGSYAKNPFWYQHFDLRGIRKLRGA